MEAARQLTLIEWRLFTLVESFDVLSTAWRKLDPNDAAFSEADW